MASDTRPGELSSKEAEKIAVELESRLRGEYPVKRRKRNEDQGEDSGSLPHPRMEPRFSRFLQWTSGIAAALAVGFIGWIAHTTFTMAGDVKVLLSRPEPVPMEQYRIDQERLQRQLDAMQNQLNTLRSQK